MHKFNKLYKSLQEQYGSEESPVNIGDLIEIDGEKQVVIRIDDDGEIFTLVVTDEGNAFLPGELNSMSFTHHGSLF